MFNAKQETKTATLTVFAGSSCTVSLSSVNKSEQDQLARELITAGYSANFMSKQGLPNTLQVYCGSPQFASQLSDRLQQMGYTVRHY